VTGTAAWVARTDPSSIDVGLDAQRALVLARDLITRLREGEVSPTSIDLDAGALDVLHAAVEIIAGVGAVDGNGALEEMSLLHDFIAAANWWEPSFAEREELLQSCSLWAWRFAREAGKPRVAEVWSRRLEVEELSVTELVREFMAEPEQMRFRGIEEPETLLRICGALRSQLEVSPLVVREEAELFYRFLSDPRRSIGLFDESDYFRGELALIAGIGCRLLARRDEAVQWFDRSEASFRVTTNAAAVSLRVAYQRLALLVEERRFTDLREQLPRLVEKFMTLDMAEDVLKCRFLEGISLTETGDFSGAASLFREITEEAEAQKNEKLLGVAYVNLVHIYGSLGQATDALAASERALAVMRRSGNNRGIAKTLLGIGTLLRTEGRLRDSVEALRSSQIEFRSLGMMADVAAGSLVVADMLLELNEREEARREILAALPVIENYKLVPEGVAALSLLRESVRQERVNHQALRDLHGFFEGRVH
jgi:tetratricopeptide (TPR) repeat protein